MMQIKKTTKLLLRYGRKLTIISILNISQNMPLPILHVFKTKKKRAAEIDNLRASQPSPNLSVCTTDTISSSAELDDSFFAVRLSTNCVFLSLYIYINIYIYLFLSLSLSLSLCYALSHIHSLFLSLRLSPSIYNSLSLISNSLCLLH